MSGNQRGSRPAFPSPVRYADDAERQIDALRNHYEDRDRPEAARNLDLALDEAEDRIGRKREVGLPAPRPYPELASKGATWIKAGRYWIAYRNGTPPVIVAVFHETADIPGRL